MRPPASPPMSTRPASTPSTRSSCSSGAARSAWTPRRDEVELDDGQRLHYDRLLLATGARPRRLRVPGADLDGVFYLRTIEAAEALRERVDRGGSVVVIGAGWIGCEVAASARQRGLEVTVIDPSTVPSGARARQEVGSVYRDIHADHGTRLLLGTGVEAIEGRRRRRASPDDRRPHGRLRLRRRRGRRRAAHRAGQAERACASTMASSSTITWRPARRGSSPPATWPTPSIPCSARRFGSSTGPTP